MTPQGETFAIYWGTAEIPWAFRDATTDAPAATTLEEAHALLAAAPGPLDIVCHHADCPLRLGTGRDPGLQLFPTDTGPVAMVSLVLYFPDMARIGADRLIVLPYVTDGRVQYLWCRRH